MSKKSAKKAPAKTPTKATPQQKAAFLAQEDAVYDALMAGDNEKARELAASLPAFADLLGQRARIRCVAALESGLFAEARAYVDEYCRLQPEGNSHFYQARVRYASGERSGLLPLLEKALTEEITAGNAVRCYNLMATIYRGRGEAAASAKYFSLAYETAKRYKLDTAPVEYDNYLFNSHYLPYDPAELAEKHFRYQEIVAGEGTGVYRLPLRRRENIRAGLCSEEARKIRIGYISPDLHEHVVLYFSRFMLTCANRERFAVYAYAHSIEDSYSEKLKAAIDGWRNIAHLSDEAAAKVVAADNLDILIDLSGHTRNSVLGILAYKPAPIVISGIGYFSTIGLDAVDYFLSDIYLAGAEEPGIYESPLFKEKLLVLPNTHWSYSPLHPRQPSCLRAPVRWKGYVSFGSFNVLAKVNDEVLAAWKAILERVPDSHLILKGDAFVDPLDREYQETRLKDFGFDMSRLDLWGSSPDYLDVYAEVDIALDTFPYGGGATTLDALYMSVPMISLIGSTHHARFGYSILQNIGLGELACPTVEEYIERACLIASDLETLDALHQNVRTMLENSILMDGRRYMAELEPFLEAVYEEHLRQEAACSPDRSQTASLAADMRKYLEQRNNQSALAMADQISATTEDPALLLEAADCYKKVAENFYPGSPVRRREALNCLAVLKRLTPQESLPCRGGDREAVGGVTQDPSNNLPCRGGGAPLNASPVGEVAGGRRGDRQAEISTYTPQPLSAAAPLEGSQLDRLSVTLLAWAEKESLDFKAETAALCDPVAQLIVADSDRQLIHQAAEKAAAAIRELYNPVPYTYDRADIQRRCLRQTADPAADEENNANKKDGKIRLGFLSPDFARTDSAKTIYPLLASLDKKRYSLNLFFTGSADNNTNEFKGIADEFVDIVALGLDSPRAAAEAIHTRDIDVLIDLTGFSRGGQTLPILMYKPAPLILSGLGGEPAVGLKEIDYIISDRFHSGIADDPTDAPLEFSLHEPGMTIPVESVIDTNDRVAIADNLPFQEKLLVLPHSPQTLRQKFEALQSPMSLSPAEAAAANDTLQAQVAVRFVPYLEKGLEFLLNRFFTDHLPPDTVNSQYETLSVTCRQLVYQRKFSAAHNLACRLSGFESHLTPDDRGILGNIFARIGCNEKAILFLQPLLNTANKLLFTAMTRPDFAPGQDLSPVEKTQHRLSVITATAASLGLPAPGALAKYLYILTDACHDRNHYIRAMIAAYLALQLLGEDTADYPADDPDNIINPLDATPYGTEDTPELTERRIMLSDLYMKVGIKMIDLSYAQTTHLFYRRSVELLPPENRGRIYSAWLMSYNFGGMSPAARTAQHLRYNELLAAVKKVAIAPPKKRPEKLRIGYMSNDFRHHVMFWFIFQLMAGYDRDHFSVTCFSLNTKQDDFTELIKNLTDSFVSLAGKNYPEQVKILRKNQVDILVDFSGHTVDGGVSLFAARVAPVQISGLGYMTTTGLKDTDYFLTDEAADPPETNPEQFFSEELIYLPSMFCYTGRSDVLVPEYAPVTKTGHILFGSFNTFRKINDEVLRLWKEILQQVENSRLLIKSEIFIDRECVHHVYKRLAYSGFDTNRVIIEQATTTYMTRYLDVDIHLDSFPYPGGGTTADALYMGVPVIALKGREHSSRFADSFLTAAGVPELLADSPAEYVAKAVALAKDIPRLDKYHRTLRNTLLNSKLMDTPGYVSTLEKAYRQLYDEWYDKNSR